MIILLKDVKIVIIIIIIIIIIISVIWRCFVSFPLRKSKNCTFTRT